MSTNQPQAAYIVTMPLKIKLLWMGNVRKKDRGKGTFSNSHMTSPNHRDEPTQGQQNTMSTVGNYPPTFRKEHRCSTNSTTRPMKHFSLPSCGLFCQFLLLQAQLSAFSLSMLERWPNTQVKLVLTTERDDHAGVEEAQERCNIKRDSGVQSDKKPPLSDGG